MKVRTIAEPQGWLWPERDAIGYRVIRQEVAHIGEVLAHVPKDRRRTAVQAGGNCGLMVQPLAATFGRVYTFEPDPVNFFCLAHNVRAPNVIKLQACVGEDDETPVELDDLPENCGATRVLRTPGMSPVLPIDALGLADVDLLMLDVEGYEQPALEGAAATIEASHPVIVLELIGQGNAYGCSDAKTTAWLEGRGYRPVARLLRDTVFVHGGQT